MAPIVAESNGGLKFIGQDVYIGGGVGMGIRESDSDLKDTFDAAIDSMKADGSLNTLIEKWFGDEASLFSDSILIIEDGQIINKGTFAEIIDLPSNVVSAELLGLRTIWVPDAHCLLYTSPSPRD